MKAVVESVVETVVKVGGGDEGGGGGGEEVAAMKSEEVQLKLICALFVGQTLQ